MKRNPLKPSTNLKLISALNYSERSGVVARCFVSLASWLNTNELRAQCEVIVRSPEAALYPDTGHHPVTRAQLPPVGTECGPVMNTGAAVTR